MTTTKQIKTAWDEYRAELAKSEQNNKATNNSGYCCKQAKQKQQAFSQLSFSESAAKKKLFSFLRNLIASGGLHHKPFFNKKGKIINKAGRQFGRIINICFGYCVKLIKGKKHLILAIQLVVSISIEHFVQYTHCFFQQTY